MSCLDAAISYARKRLPVFPCQPAGEGAKRPYPRTHGFKDATTDEATIRSWWSEHPDALVALPTGAVSGFVVLDVDVDIAAGRDGEASLKALLTTHGAVLPETRIARTPRGGRHIFFKHPGRHVYTRTDYPAQFLDVRGDGGYVIVAPSQTSVGRYEWVANQPAAPMPTWLESLLTAPIVGRAGPIVGRAGLIVPAVAGIVQAPDDGRRVRDALSVIASDSRDIWLRIGFALHSWDSGESGYSIWRDWSSKSEKFDEAVQRRTWSSMKTDRPAGVSIATLFGIARENGWHDRPKSKTSSIAREYLLAELPASWPDRKPLPDTMPPVTPLPLAALPKAMRPWISDCADRMQCSPDFLIAAALVAAGSVVGNRIGIAPKRHDIWVEVPIFWGAIVGRPGTMKSPALGAALAPITRLEAQAAEEFRQAEAEAEGEELVRDQLRKRESKRIGEIAAKNPDEAKRLAMQLVASADEEGPACRRYFTNDPTVPKVGELLRDNPTGLLLLRDELSGWFRALDSDGHEGDRSFFLEGWNGKNSLTIDRIERGTVRIPRHCLSVLGGIQPGPLGAIVRGAVRCGSGDDGLLQRFGLLVWPDKTGWVNVDRPPNKTARDSYIACFNLLDVLDPSGVGGEDMGDDGIPALRFDPAAQDAFDEWRANHERALRTGDEHPAFEAYLCKVPRTVATLALLHHLADGGSGPVPLRSLESALSLQSALATHARRLYAPALMGPAMAARELARHLERGDLDGSFTVREVYRRGWSNLDTPELARDGCLYLLDLGWLREASGASNGRPSESFEAHPEILGKAPPGTDKTDKRGVLSVLSVRQTPAEGVLSVLSVPPHGLFENSTTPREQRLTPLPATPSGPASESWPDESPLTEPPGDLPKVDANGHVIEEGAL